MPMTLNGAENEITEKNGEKERVGDSSLLMWLNQRPERWNKGMKCLKRKRNRVFSSLKRSA